MLCFINYGYKIKYCSTWVDNNSLFPFNFPAYLSIIGGSTIAKSDATKTIEIKTDQRYHPQRTPWPSLDNVIWSETTTIAPTGTISIKKEVNDEKVIPEVNRLRPTSRNNQWRQPRRFWTVYHHGQGWRLCFLPVWSDWAPRLPCLAIRCPGPPVRQATDRHHLPHTGRLWRSLHHRLLWCGRQSDSAADADPGWRSQRPHPEWRCLPWLWWPGWAWGVVAVSAIPAAMRNAPSKSGCVG